MTQTLLFPRCACSRSKGCKEAEERTVTVRVVTCRLALYDTPLLGRLWPYVAMGGLLLRRGERVLVRRLLVIDGWVALAPVNVRVETLLVMSA